MPDARCPVVVFGIFILRERLILVYLNIDRTILFA